MKKRLLLNLRYVPDDEREEVLALLEQHHIEHYVTPAGPFGISAGAIWIRHEQDTDRAWALFDGYQVSRARRASAERAEQQARGERERFWTMWRARPWYVTCMILLSLVVLMIFFAPMLQIAQIAR